MAFDTYLIIGGGSVIKGEATAKGLKPAAGWMEIFSFSWGVSNPTTVGTSGKGLSAGKASVSSFNVMKKSDNASPSLFAACCGGTHFDNASVVMRKATGKDGGQAEFLRYDFESVMIESLQWSGSSGGDDTPTESVSFAFGKVTIQNWIQDTAKGELAKGASAIYSIVEAAKG